MGNAVLNEVMEANLTDPKPSPDSDMWDGERERKKGRVILERDLRWNPSLSWIKAAVWIIKTNPLLKQDFYLWMLEIIY